MSIIVEAVYENGVFRPIQPVSLPEHARVTVTVVAGTGKPDPAVVPCADPRVIEWAATDAELEYPPSPEMP
jgi:hypothetical protein